MSPRSSRAREAQERLGERTAPARDQPPVFHHHEERVLVLRILLSHVRHQIGTSVTLENAGEVGRDGRCETAGRLALQRSPGLRHGPDVEHRLNDKHGGEECHDAERDSQVQAAIPPHRHEYRV